MTFLTMIHAKAVGYRKTSKGVIVDHDRVRELVKPIDEGSWQPKNNNGDGYFQEVRRWRMMKGGQRFENTGGGGQTFTHGEDNTVFVEYINKKLYKRWLTEIFEQYGRVEDVHIAYKTRKDNTLIQPLG